MLKAAEVAPLIDMPKAIELTEASFAEHAHGNVKVHAPYHLLVEGGALRVVSAANNDSKRMGLRYGPAVNLTPPSGFRHHICTLYDTNGDLLAMMGYPFSTLRTGATVAVAVKHMTPPGPKRIGLLGTGNNALSLLHGVRHVREIKDVTIYSRDADRRRAFAAEAEKSLGLPARPAAANRDAVSGMDIVLTATNFRQPLFPVEWLDDGCHVSSMGPIGEVPEALFLSASHVVVSCIDHEENYFQPTKPFPLVDLIRAGRMTWDEVDELGAVVTGAAKARRRAGGITLFHESAGGFGDIAFASHAYEEAKKRGLGQEVSF